MNLSAEISVVVGSQNPVKVNAVKHAFSRAFEGKKIKCISCSAPSEVSDQPLSEAETLAGAQNRVKYCQANHQADFYVAIEGGVDNFTYGTATFAFVVIADQHQSAVGRSANLPLPTDIFTELTEGAELGPVMDKWFNTQNIKQKGGAISLLTNGLATRQGAYEQALIQAMAPFLHPTLYG